MGGLARRAGVIDIFRGPGRGVLVLDGGDSILNVPRADAPVLPFEQQRAVVMLRGLGVLGADALAPGEAELALGVEKLVEVARQYEVPLLASNVQSAEGRAVFQPRRLLQVGAVKVGLFALYRPPSPAKSPRGPRVLDDLESARTQVAALRKEGAELIVMLAHLGMPRAREVAAAVPGIHLGLVGHTGWRSNEPEAVSGKTFLVEAGRRGQMLAHLEVRLGEGWQPDASLVDDSRRHVLYDEAGREIRDARKEGAAAHNEQTWRDRVLPHAERARALAKQLAQARPPSARHTLVSRLIELDENAPEQAAMKAMVHAGILAVTATPPAAKVPVTRRPPGRRP